MVDTRDQYLHLHDLYVPIALAVWVIFAAIFAFAVVRYRRREGRPPATRRDAPRAEGAYAIVLAAIAAFLCFETFRTEDKVDRVAAHPGLQVHVVGSRWQWRFDYPQYGITLAAPGERPETLVLPARTTIQFNGTSTDVIHSFWIPNRRFKRDLIPGTVNRFDLMWPKPGVDAGGECGEFCGLDHSNMRFTIRVVSADAFRRWAQARR